MHKCAQSVHKVCTKCAQRTSVHSLLQECTIKMIKLQVCTKCMKMLVTSKTIIYVLLVYTWAKSRQRYPEPLSVGSGSLYRAADRPAVLTRPVGRSGGRCLGVQQHVVGHVSATGKKAVVMM